MTYGKRKSSNRFTHHSQTKAKTIDERIRELSDEGIAVRGRDRFVLASENLHLNEVDFKTYSDRIDIQADMSPDDENNLNELLTANNFDRYFIIPSNSDNREVVEYFLRYSE